MVHQLLEKDPADRPPTALAVMNRLKAMRAGLQRAQTLLSEGSPTEIGPVENATSDTDPAGIKRDRNRRSHVNDDPTIIPPASHSETDSGQAGIESLGERRSAHATTPTVLSDTRKSKTIPPGGNEKGPKSNKTHFQTVSDQSPATSVFGKPSDAKSIWSHWLGISIMLVALFLGVAIFFKAMRPPTADQLYLTATQAEDNGARRAFLKRFPEDPRVVEVRDLYMADQSRAALKRLSTQTKLGIKPLLAAEEGFVAAMQGREQSPREAIDRLQQWLNVFDNTTNRDDTNLKALIELAEYEQARLGAARSFRPARSTGDRIDAGN